MKISTESKTTTTTYYQCENCGTKHTWSANVGKCSICGDEICIACSDNEFEIIDVDNLGFTSHAEAASYNAACINTNCDGYTKYYLCSKCSTSKLKRLQNGYDKKVAKLVAKFNKDLDKLNKQYEAKLKGI